MFSEKFVIFNWSKLETRLASLISALINPLVLPTLGMLFLFNLDTHIAFSIPQTTKRLILAIVFFNTCLAPVFAILLLKKSGIINDMLLNERKDRLVPLLVSALFFFATYFLIRQVSTPNILSYYILGATLLILLTLLITYKWKISIHMTSIGGLTGFIISLGYIYRIDITGILIPIILISGLLGTARLKVNAHNLAQVLAGYVLGVAVTIFILLFRIA
ncbi:MAG TPA: hypothetical protein VLH61_10125 [Bacteroidales bacterium]|nr:hypothetical protein [Bacteroidales bacterium]